jgi:SAM-dependent methyltransferase
MKGGSLIVKDVFWKILQIRMKRWTRSGINEFLEENLHLVNKNRILVIGGFGPILDFIHRKSTGNIIETLDIELKHNPDYLLDISHNKLPDLINKKFDKIICIEVLEHVPNYQKALENIYELLEKGGTIIGSTPWIIPLHDQPFDFHRFTYFEIERVLKLSGFSQITIESRGNYLDSILALGIRGLISPNKIDKIMSLFFTIVTLFLPKPKRIKGSQYSTIGYSFKAKKILQ